MNKESVIIMTSTEKEVKELYEFLGKEFSLLPSSASTNGWYDTKWYWVIKEGKYYAGSSGCHALEHTIENYPNLPIKTLRLYIADSKLNNKGSFAHDLIEGAKEIGKRMKNDGVWNEATLDWVDYCHEHVDEEPHIKFTQWLRKNPKYKLVKT